MATIQYTAYASSVIEGNLALFVQLGSASPDPIGWANVRATVGIGTGSFPSSGTYAGDLEVYQALYPYVLTGNNSYTIFGRLYGQVISGNATMTKATFGVYSPLTQLPQIRFITAQTFKR
jgi:hypothetical protein